jgi:NADPH-dependent 2,4-dienoyl-CoA reductase/sulfur reductase-like enzyme
MADEEYAEKAWVRYEDIAALQPSGSSSSDDDGKNIRVLHGSVQSVDTQHRVASFVARGGGTQTAELHYDFLVAASGLRRAWPVSPRALRRKPYLSEAAGHIRSVTTGRHGVVVVGGGWYFFSPSLFLLHLDHFRYPYYSIPQPDSN